MIIINEQYAIKADDRQYILIERKNRKQGKDAGQPCENPIGYYRTVSQALTDVCRRMQRRLIQDKDMTLETALHEFERVERGI